MSTERAIREQPNQLDAAFETRDFDVGQLFLAVEAQVLPDILFGDVVAAHIAFDELTVPDKLAWRAFDQSPETVGLVRSECHQPMKAHDYCTPAEGREKRRAAVDGASEHGRQNDQQRRIESAFFRERPLIAEANDDESEDHHDRAAQTDLAKSEMFRLELEAEQGADEIPEGVHVIGIAGDRGDACIERDGRLTDIRFAIRMRNLKEE